MIFLQIIITCITSEFKISYVHIYLIKKIIFFDLFIWNIRFKMIKLGHWGTLCIKCNSSLIEHLREWFYSFIHQWVGNLLWLLGSFMLSNQNRQEKIYDGFSFNHERLDSFFDTKCIAFKKIPSYLSITTFIN